MLEHVGLADDPRFAKQYDADAQDEMQMTLEGLFASKTRTEWEAILTQVDACFAPVLSMTEAPNHPHNLARRTFVETDGVVQPAPVPRFVGTPSDDPTHGDAGSITFDAVMDSWSS